MKLLRKTIRALKRHKIYIATCVIFYAILLTAFLISKDRPKVPAKTSLGEKLGVKVFP